MFCINYTSPEYKIYEYLANKTKNNTKLLKFLVFDPRKNEVKII